MKNRFGILWITVLLLVIGCTGRTGTPSQAFTATISLQPTQPNRPSTTPTWPKPTETTIRITRTVNPISHTPTPTIKIITPTPTATPTPIVFPSWISDPGIDVLMTNTGAVLSIQKYLTFLNANTGERFDFPMAPAYGHFWLFDGKEFGILSSSGVDIAITDFTTGKSTHFPINKNITRYLGIFDTSSIEQSWPLLATGSSPLDKKFLLVQLDEGFSAPLDTLSSSDNRFVVIFHPENSAHFFIEDLLIPSISEVFPPHADFVPFDFAWSPTDDRLAILYSEPSKDQNQPSQSWLGVYDPLSSSFTKFFKGIKGVNWSPDGKKIMFDRADYIGYQGSSEEDLQRKFTSKPCIFDLTTQNLRCLDYIRNRYGEADLGNYQWSPDGKSIAYRVSNLICVVTLATSKINCPTQGITELKDLSINSFSWSPDGRFLEFIYDSACHACDYLDEPRIGIVSVRDGNYHLFGDFPDVPWRPRLWRPKVTP